MTARSRIMDALKSDTTLQQLGLIPTSVFASGSVEAPTPKPFCVVRWQETEPGIGPSNRRRVTVFFHDEPGSYTRINKMISRCRVVLVALSATGTPADWISDVEWRGDSGDFPGEPYGTIMRNADFNVVSNSH